jgi:replicative DNA helicase
MAYLGSIIVDSAMISETASGISRRMFELPVHALIFDAVVGLHAKAQPIDVVTLRDELAKLGTLSAVGGADYLLDLVNGVPNAASAPAYAATIIERYKKRLLLSTLAQIKASVENGVGPIDAMGVINKAIIAVGEAEGAGAIIFLNQILDDALRHRPQTENPVVTRIGKIDSNINLFCPGELTIVAARPSVGKSSLMRQMCVNAATAGVALVFSLEVTPRVLSLQMACELAGVPYSDYARNRSSDEDVNRVILAGSDQAMENVAAYSRTNMSAMDVSLAVTQLQASGKPVAAVFIDYLGLMRHDRAERNDLAVGATTRLLKQIAIERKVPIILLAQLNREVEKRGGGSECDRPRLADLRDSGNIEQDADNVVFLWRKERDDQYKVVEPRVLTVAKHRNGQVFEVDLMFDKAKGRFYEVNERGQQTPVAEWESK